MFLARSTTAFVLKRPATSAALQHAFHHGRPLTKFTSASTRLFSNSAPFEIASQQEVLMVFQKPNAIILDVRSQAEIDDAGKIATSNWLQVNCTPADCPTLSDTAQEKFPDKETPVVIHCASGMRAAKAQEILEEMGYTDVVNAGGYRDLGYLQEAADEKK